MRACDWLVVLATAVLPWAFAAYGYPSSRDRSLGWSQREDTSTARASSQQLVLGPAVHHNSTWKDRWLLRQSIQALHTFVESQRAQKSTPYAPRRSYPPLKSWSRQRGIYDSFVHLNFHGKLPRSALLRNGYKFPDDNAFVTMFVLEALLDVQEFAGDLDGVSVEDVSVLESVAAVLAHRDRNQPQGVPVYSFWNQIALKLPGNSTTDDSNIAYKSSPPNIEVPISEARHGFEQIQRFLTRFLANDTKLAKFVNTAVVIGQSFGNTFKIPADADDTGCSLALGMKLQRLQKSFPFSAGLWKSMNANVSSVFGYFQRYAYRPFASESEYAARSIDPRTFVWIREFLYEVPEDRQTRDFALLTTWMQSIDQVQGETAFRRMPFAVNNVDLSVTVNALYGWSQLILSDWEARQVFLADPGLQQMFKDNVDLIVFAIDNRIVVKFNALSLLYYPPKFAFYWFVARLVRLLGEWPSQVDLPEPLEYAGRRLNIALKTQGTVDILALSKTEQGGFTFWDDFLGNADIWKEETKPLHEDRVFSTSMALNALFDIWTERAGETSTGRPILVFAPDVTLEVEKAIHGAISFLLKRAPSFPKQNGIHRRKRFLKPADSIRVAFFSGSIKNGGSGNPFYYPHNSFRWVNGTSAGSCSDFNSTTAFGFKQVFELVVSVSGIIPREEYDRQLKNQLCFGKHVPVDQLQLDLNCDGCVFPYWSSPALTGAMEMLALSKAYAMVVE